MHALKTALFVTSLVLCGCRRAEPDARPGPVRGVAQAHAVQEPEVAAPPPPPTEADVRAVLDRWLAVQNGGDFAAYQRLYASRFAGVRRSGSRVERFDRDGWMTDRGRMFGRPMRVAATDVVVRSMPGSAEIVFRQAWSSGSYSDEGPKRMLLVAERDGLRIANEEMLESRIADDLDARLASGPFVTVAGAHTFVVFSNSEDAGEGAPSVDDVDSFYYVTKRPSAALAARLASLRGREVAILSRTGECRSVLGEPVLLRIVVPHFGTVATWRGERDDGSRGAQVPAATVAVEAWDLADVTLVAAPVVGRCGGHLARFADGPEGRVLAGTEVPESARAPFIARFDQAHPLDAAEFVEGEEVGPHMVASYPLPGGRTLVSVRRSIPSGCAAGLTVEHYVVTGDTMTTLELHDEIRLVVLRGGVVELLAVEAISNEPTLYRLGAETVRLSGAAIAYRDCPC